MSRQIVTIEIRLSVDAGLAEGLEGRPARMPPERESASEYPLSGLEVAAEILGDRLADLAVEVLAPIAAARIEARYSIGRPFDASLEPF